MSGATTTDPHRWTFSFRAIANQIERATLRTTLTYQFHPRFSAGLELNPLVPEVNPLANWIALTEATNRPALILGTSSDRIGTPHGQSFYATVSKDLRALTRLPVAPYLGVAYGTYNHRVRPIGGLNVEFPRGFSGMLLFDGVHLHPTFGYAYKAHSFGIILVRGHDPGLTYSLRF